MRRASAVKTQNNINQPTSCQTAISIKLCTPTGNEITSEIGLNIYGAAKLQIAFPYFEKRMFALSVEVLLVFNKSELMRKLLYGNRFADCATCASLF